MSSLFGALGFTTEVPAAPAPEPDTDDHQNDVQKLSLLNTKGVIVIKPGAADKPSTKCGWTTWSIAAKANGLARAWRAQDEDSIDTLYKQAVEAAKALRKDDDTSGAYRHCIDSQEVLLKFSGKISFISATMEPFRIVEFNKASRTAADRKSDWGSHAYFAKDYDSAATSIDPEMLEQSLEKVLVGQFIVCATNRGSFVAIKLEDDLWLYCDNDVTLVAEFRTETLISHFFQDYAASILSETPSYNCIIFAVGISKD